MKLATLLYIRNRNGDYLLMERSKDPNKGLISPPGGKLDQDEAETPSRCAVREAYEECAMVTNESDWKVKGIVTEKNFPGVGNIMLFLMEYKETVDSLPAECNEGRFRFVNPAELHKQNLPVTDRFFLWDYYFKSDETFTLALDCTDYPLVKSMQY